MELSEEQAKQRQRERRMEQARQLATIIPEALEGGPVPHQTLLGFAAMIAGLLRKDET